MSPILVARCDRVQRSSRRCASQPSLLQVPPLSTSASLQPPTNEVLGDANVWPASASCQERALRCAPWSPDAEGSARTLDRSERVNQEGEPVGAIRHPNRYLGLV